MDSNQFEKIQRQGEVFHGIRVPNGVYPIVRVDGRSFTKLTEKRGYEKPFDIFFHDVMTFTAKTLLVELGGVYAFTESDEISVLLPRDSDLFNRSWEKIVSVSAGMATSAFVGQTSDPACFDSRIHVAANIEAVKDYFSWRQADAQRCALNGWVYWTCRKGGLTGAAADKIMKGMSVNDKKDFLAAHEIDWTGSDIYETTVPAWQRRGTGLYWEYFLKEGFNPITKETVRTPRRAVTIDDNLPSGQGYAQFFERFNF